MQQKLSVDEARRYIRALSHQLEQLLFEGTADDRHSWRDELGQDWKHFLELTRAMTGEAAFRITLEEGRLSKPPRNTKARGR